MDFHPPCLINVFLALAALVIYIVGSYRFYKNAKGYTLLLGIAIGIDILTAILASLRITPTVEIAGTSRVPYNSILFIIHVCFSMTGFLGFIALFIYLLSMHPSKYAQWIRTWQFRFLLPVWVIGECIAITNALSKIFYGIRIFEYW